MLAEKLDSLPGHRAGFFMSKAMHKRFWDTFKTRLPCCTGGTRDRMLTFIDKEIARAVKYVVGSDRGYIQTMGGDKKQYHESQGYNKRGKDCLERAKEYKW